MDTSGFYTPSVGTNEPRHLAAESSTTRGTAGKLTWYTSHVAQGHPLSISKQFRRTDVDFGESSTPPAFQQ